jgi:hypothetical protein
MIELHIDKITVQALPEDMARKIDETHSMVLEIYGKVNAMADTADQILAGVGRMRTKVESLEALTDKLFGLYSELRDDPAKLQQVLDTVADIESGADAAIVRNTPEDAGGGTGGTDTGGATDTGGGRSHAGQ